MQDFKVKNNKISFKDFMGWRQVVPEIKSLPYKFLIFMAIACVIIIFFNFFNVQGASQGWDTGTGANIIHHKGWFLPLAQYHDALKNGSTFGHSGEHGQAVAVAVLYSLNGLASFTGILAASLIAFDKSTQYFWGFISSVFYGLFAISTGYLGDLIMEAIIIICAPLGWYLFEKVKQNPNHNQKKSWKFNVFFFIGVAIAIAIVTLVLYEFLPNAFRDTFGKLADNQNNPYYYISNGTNVDDSGNIIPVGQVVKDTGQRVMDSLGNGFNFVGYIMQLANFDEQMYIWALNDTIKLLKFTDIVPGTLSVNMLIQFAVWISLDVIGIYNRLFRDWINNLFRWIKSLFIKK